MAWNLIDSSKYTIHNIPDDVVRHNIEEMRLESFLKDSPTFYLHKMTYEPYDVLPLDKETMEYEMENEGTNPEDYRQFKYIYRQKIVQLNIFE